MRHAASSTQIRLRWAARMEIQKLGFARHSLRRGDPSFVRITTFCVLPAACCLLILDFLMNYC
jgi:hypothetical protein